MRLLFQNNPEYRENVKKWNAAKRARKVAARPVAEEESSTDDDPDDVADVEEL